MERKSLVEEFRKCLYMNGCLEFSNADMDWNNNNIVCINQVDFEKVIEEINE